MQLFSPDVRECDPVADFENAASFLIDELRAMYGFQPVMTRKDPHTFLIAIPTRITDAFIERPIIVRFSDRLDAFPIVKDVTILWDQGVYTFTVRLRH